jgi:hypothetical protein
MCPVRCGTHVSGHAADSRLRIVTGCVTETPNEPRTGTLPICGSMCSNSIGRLDREEREVDQSRSHRMAYPRRRILLQRRRDRPRDFSIKSTKVQSFDTRQTHPRGMSRPVRRTFAVLSSRGGVNWRSGCSFIDTGRCITGGYSKPTIQIQCARNLARESAPISAKGSPTSSGRRPVVARSLTFQDGRQR